jgi:hypothetical protein
MEIAGYWLAWWKESVCPTVPLEQLGQEKSAQPSVVQQ